MPIEAVIFDLDGTLATFNLNYKSLRADARSILLHATVPASVVSINESIFEMLKKTEIFFKNQGKSAAAFKKVKDEVLALAEKYEYEAASSTSLILGVEETLKNLRAMGVKIGLCTISSGKSVDFILKRFKIADYFGVVVSRDDVKDVKPNPEQFELALKKLGASSDVALFVGDSVVDMQSAKEIKAVAVGFASGVSTPEQLMSNGADYLITSLNDLPVLIEKINKT
jgi:HAD superfamily hydrolase (TIGR01549 family)